MGDRICISFDPRRQPWLSEFDRFDRDGRRRPDSVIGEADLEEWAKHSLSEFAIESRNIRFNARCAMFKYDTDARLRFLREIAGPEMLRTTPLSDSERRDRARMAMVKSKEATVRAQSALSGFKTKCSDVEDEAACNMMIQRYVAFSGSLSSEGLCEYLESINYRRSVMAGCGIGFTKVVGQPAYVNFVHADLVSAGLENLLRDAAILAIDGRDTRPMTWAETWEALRGPTHTIVELKIRTADGSMEIVPIVRRPLSLSFRTYWR